jgi:hypothetical protein
MILLTLLPEGVHQISVVLVLLDEPGKDREPACCTNGSDTHGCLVQEEEARHPGDD